MGACPGGASLTGVATAEQRAVCARFAVEPVPAPGELMAGVALPIGDPPVHGLRHPPEHGTTGWFVWTGEYSVEDDFFKPLHVSHLERDLAVAVPYLALPPGWRFLLAPGYEDVWFDETLLDST